MALDVLGFAGTVRLLVLLDPRSNILSATAVQKAQWETR